MPLPPEEWRYYVISFHGNNQTLVKLENACAIAQQELEIGFTVLRSGTLGGLLYHTGRFFHALENAHSSQDFFIDVSASSVEELVAIHARLEQQDERLAWLRPRVAHVAALKELPPQSTMRFLGLFAILESLLTHVPQATDPYDSITRQVKKKLALLNNRFTTPLDYQQFGTASPDTVWAKMYAYRSALAHGGTPDFEVKLRVLRDHKQAYQLLTTTVKAVLRHGLNEPQLLADLREC